MINISKEQDRSYFVKSGNDFHLRDWFISRRAGGIEIMYLRKARKSKLEGFEYFVNNPIAIILRTRLVSEQLCKSLPNYYQIEIN